MRRRLIASFALALAVLVVFVRAVGPGRVATDLAGVRGSWAALAVALALATFLAWSESLRQLYLGADTDVAHTRFRLAFLSGVFAKQVLPAGNASGPAFIAYAVNTESDNRYEYDLAVATVGELSNLGASLVVATAGIVALLFAGGGTNALLGFGAIVVGTGAVAVSGLLALLFLRRSAFDALVRRLGWLVRATAGRRSGRIAAAVAPARVDAWLDGFGRPLAALATDRRALGLGLSYSLVGWLSLSLCFVASGLALGHGLPVVLGLFVVPVGGFASAFPLPGGVGGIEVAMAALVVALVGTELVAATATVLLFRLASFWLVLAVGGLASVYLSLDVGEMPRAPPIDEESA